MLPRLKVNEHIDFRSWTEVRISNDPSVEEGLGSQVAIRSLGVRLGQLVQHSSVDDNSLISKTHFLSTVHDHFHGVG